MMSILDDMILWGGEIAVWSRILCFLRKVQYFIWGKVCYVIGGNGLSNQGCQCLRVTLGVYRGPIFSRAIIECSLIKTLNCNQKMGNSLGNLIFFIFSCGLGELCDTKFTHSSPLKINPSLLSFSQVSIAPCQLECLAGTKTLRCSQLVSSNGILIF